MLALCYSEHMFIRTKKTPRSQSVSIQLVESFREYGKIRQRVLRHVGTADTPEKIEALKKMANALKTELYHESLKATPDAISNTSRLGHLTSVHPKRTLSATQIEETSRRILGIHDVYGTVYEKLGFSNPFSHPSRRTHAASLLKEIVLARIAQPQSKRASVQWLETHCNISLNLDHVYQMMDKIDDAFCENIQRQTLKTTLKLTNGKLRVLFYDATTLYFESFSEDDLKQNGYSKDFKFNQPQVLLTLFVTEQGLPVGYELFPGATFEGHTLIPVLEKLKERYQLEQVVFVADRGLLSQDNLDYLEKNNFQYIVGARIKNMTREQKEAILDEKNYQSLSAEGHLVAMFEQKNHRTLLVHYDPKRARKDCHDRLESIEKLRKKLLKSKEPKSLLNNFGYKKYLEIRGETKLSLNEAKITEAARWDGRLGILTNLKNVEPECLLTYYRGLWQIEESFRVNKHDLAMRPIYHWAPQRIRAHIAIAFMAFACVRYLEYRLSIQSQALSPESIRQALLQTQASIIVDHKDERHYLLPSKISSEAKEIYRLFNLRFPTSIMEIKNCSA